MENGVSEEQGVTRYGIDAGGNHSYTNKERSGLPMSYFEVVKGLIAGTSMDSVFLDVGGGTGELAGAVRDFGRKAVSVDYSPAGMEETGNEGAVVSADALPFAEKSVGVVHSKDMIEHLNDAQLEKFISETKRVLEDGGKVIITARVYHTSSLLAKYFKLDVPWINTYLFDQKTNKNIVEQENLQPGESYGEAVARLSRGRVDKVKFSPPYYPRSDEDLRKVFEVSGYLLEKKMPYWSKKEEPEWFENHSLRKIMVFKKADLGKFEEI